MIALHILLLTRHDWARAAAAGGTDAILAEQVPQWRRWGHEVTVVAARRTRAALRCWLGPGRDADVVLEVMDHVPFFTPLWWWLDIPHVTLVHHTGRHKGALASFVQKLALRTVYRHHTFLTITPETHDELVAMGIPPEAVNLALAGKEEPAAALTLLEEVAAEERARLRDAVMRSQTGTAAGLAAATLTNNAIQLLFTMIFTRLLGAEGYGALAALVSAFLILMVGGQAVQALAARESALGSLGDPAMLRLTMRRWVGVLAAFTLLVGIASVLAREQLAELCGVEEHPWAAAAILPTGSLWLLLSLQRGALQGLHAYAPVGLSLIGEAAGRVLCALALFAVGMGVTGAFLGTTLAFAITAVVLGAELSRRLGQRAERHERTRSLLSLVRANWLPIGGLLLLAILQNVDVILARHELGGKPAGSYAAAAVAAKAVVWVAIGVGLQLLPEATRRAASGEDPRPVLLRALVVLAVVATPALLIFAAVPEQLLTIAFGDEDLAIAAPALPLLGLAMTLLAVAYLTVQYLVALGETRFIAVLAVAALAEPVLLLKGNFSLIQFAQVVLVTQLAVAAILLAVGLRARPQPQPLIA